MVGESNCSCDHLTRLSPIHRLAGLAPLKPIFRRGNCITTGVHSLEPPGSPNNRIGAYPILDDLVNHSIRNDRHPDAGPLGQWDLNLSYPDLEGTRPGRYEAIGEGRCSERKSITIPSHSIIKEGS